jgi:hypothetical protein
MKITFIITFIISILIPLNVIAEDTSNKCNTFSNKDGYELYKQREQCICEQYKSSTNIVDIKEDYPKVMPNSKSNNNKYSLNDTKKNHRENMNLIYKC